MKYLPVLFILFALKCNQEDDKEVFSTDLELIVQDANETPFIGATVYLFDNEVDYNNARNNSDYSGAIFSGITNDVGQLVFGNLSDDVNYYFHVVYTSGVDNLTNQNTDFFLRNELEEGSVTTAVIVLQSNRSFISFWTSNRNQRNLAVDVYLGDLLIGQLDSTRTSSPSLTDQQGALVYEIAAGTYNWNARGEGGCYWEGTLDVQETDFIVTELMNCTNGTVKFYSEQASATIYPIDVTINFTDDLGSVSGVSIGVVDCSSADGVSANRAAGNYTYEARSADGNCVWVGTFDLAPNECELIKLGDCN